MRNFRFYYHQHPKSYLFIELLNLLIISRDIRQRLIINANMFNMNTAKKLATLKRIRKFSRLMDTAIGIPGTKFRIGLDPIIGLVPGAGDMISTIISAYIIYLATRVGVSRDNLFKMILNVGFEAVVGTVPLFGDLFDAFYKSNIRNLAILEEHIIATEPELKKVDTQLSAKTPVKTV